MSKTLPQIGGTGRAGGAVGGESVAPEFFGVQTSDPAPRIDNSPYFLFRHHPNDWIVKGGAVIPQLRKLKLVNGINNVTNSKGPDGKLTWDISTAQTMIQKKGAWSSRRRRFRPRTGKRPTSRRSRAPTPTFRSTRPPMRDPARSPPTRGLCRVLPIPDRRGLHPAAARVHSGQAPGRPPPRPRLGRTVCRALPGLRGRREECSGAAGGGGGGHRSQAKVTGPRRR